MHTSIRRVIFAAFAIFFSFSIPGLWAQSAGSAGTIYGTVTDTTGAIVPGATVTIENPVSGYSRTTTSDSEGHYQFTNLPFNPYHLAVSTAGFAPYSQDVDVRSTVPSHAEEHVSPSVRLRRSSTSTPAAICWRTTPRFTPTSIAAVRQASRSRASLRRSARWSRCLRPASAADSNGLFHGLGDHASNSFSIDGQPITDQQSKVFSNQLPSNSVQSTRSDLRRAAG